MCIRDSYQLIHLFAQKAIEDPDAFCANKEAMDLSQAFERKSRTLLEAKEDLLRWNKWQEQGLRELIETEHEMRPKDFTGAALKRWREEEMEALIVELMKLRS